MNVKLRHGQIDVEWFARVHNAEDQYRQLVQCKTMTTSGGTASYVYDGLGQRVRRQVGAQPATYYAYDLQGQLLGEYQLVGATYKALVEYVWFDGQPIAAIRPKPGATSNADQEVFYLHTDHLGAPRVAVDQQNRVRWRWLSPEPFGTGAAESNPSGLGDLVINLRFPGQQFDNLVGLSYNYFRDYDASTGRYVQSDPIGLNGGINTYAYVHGNPLVLNDPYGLYSWMEFVDDASETSAGFGDSLTLGLTGHIRNGLGISHVDKCSRAYRNGELADLAFEVGTMGLSAGLKVLAAKASREGVRKGTRSFMDAFRDVNNLEGGFVHHSNPLFGHPGGFSTIFPTGGLPASINSGAWNLRWFPSSATHSAAHRWMRYLENAARVYVNPATTSARAVNDFANDCSCSR